MRSTLAILDVLASAPDVLLQVPGVAHAGGFDLHAMPPIRFCGETLVDVHVLRDGVRIETLLPAVPDGETSIHTHWIVENLRSEIAKMAPAELAD